MTDEDCIQFLQWSLPRLRMRWQGFRKVRGQVCKRINARVHELALIDIKAYRSYLEDHADEWAMLDTFCRVTVSRFYRDRELFLFLEREALTKLSESALSQGDNRLRCWCIGCASGEEPYTLALMWDLVVRRSYPTIDIGILATDSERIVIDRAARGCYTLNSLKDLPPEWIEHAFIRQGDLFCIRSEERKKVALLVHDIRSEMPEGLFHLVLCRNLVFTYFDEALQGEVLARIRDKIVFGGALVIGIHESLPSGHSGFEPWPGITGVYRKV